jgi:hypothetical protein
VVHIAGRDTIETPAIHLPWQLIMDILYDLMGITRNCPFYNMRKGYSPLNMLPRGAF